VSDTDSVSVTTVVAIDPAAAFEVFTREVDAWWRHGPRFRPGIGGRVGVMRFEPGVGGRLLEVYDAASGDCFELGRVRVWEPGASLVFEMGGRDFEPGQTTEVEIRFEGGAQGTRVTVEHRGWDRLPAGHPARHGMTGTAFADVMATWWSDALTALRFHVDAAHGDRP
jgi:hypothetical protein